ncbi:hypothetical protein F8566_09675 [Actinomadura rudentiformis]|uniref:Cyclophilin-like domain-containing protein n=2 Tax=Actinomadura rudentiformis TaxID=359158 RepID=A0A6H9YVS1_9ACTN|nr:hypothetical protein F8566_09675 [Actinomadura rudentiformis]
MPRATLRLAAVTALAVAVAACSSGQPAPSAEPSASAPRPTAPRGTPAAPSERNSSMDIRVTLDGQPVNATLNGSPAARDLASLLPLTLDLEDFHGTERIGYPPRKLTTDGAPAPAAAKAGDIAYFAPWGNLALFYKDGPSASADLLILGHIDADTAQLAKAQRITIQTAP